MATEHPTTGREAGLQHPPVRLTRHQTGRETELLYRTVNPPLHQTVSPLQHQTVSLLPHLTVSLHIIITDPVQWEVVVEVVPWVEAAGVAAAVEGVNLF